VFLKCFKSDIDNLKNRIKEYNKMKKNLNYIIKVSEYGNINKAAEKLYITPSALSKFIITKERELGVELFERTGKKFVLTYAGEKYVEWAKKIVHMQSCMEREINSIAKEKTGLMHLGFQLMQSKILFTKIIPIFKEQYPDIEIVLESNYAHNLANMLDEEMIEFAITTHNSEKDNLNYIKLAEIEIAVVVPKGHKIINSSLNKRGFNYPWIDIKDLKNETFVGLYKNQEPRIIMDEIFKKCGINPKINMQVHTTELTLLSVANNFGVTIAYDMPAKFEEYKNSVQLLSFGKQPVFLNLSIVFKKDYQKKEYVKKFIDICKSCYSEIFEH
jgi:DNA-binding transcriptional LysR family regulator